MATVAIKMPMTTAAIRESLKKKRAVGMTPVMRRVARALNAMANRFVAYSRADPSASTPSRAPMRIPVAASGGTSATATATPGRVAETSS